MSRLDFSSTELTSAELSEIVGSHDDLVSLDVSHCRIDALPLMPQLMFLNISFNRRFTGDGLSALTNLTHLNVAGCSLISMEAITPLTKLAYLNLDFGVHADVRTLPPHLVTLILDPFSVLPNLEYIPRFHNLVSLTLDQAPITDLDLTTLRTLPYLSVLSVSETRIDGSGLPHHLTNLNLTSCMLLNLEYIARLTRLNVLTLAHTNITSDDLVYLRHLPLSHLNLSATLCHHIDAIVNVPLVHLDLSYLELDSVSVVKVLVNLRELSYLGLSHSRFNIRLIGVVRGLRTLQANTLLPKITDDDLKYLYNLGLDNLSIEDNNLSAHGDYLVFGYGIVRSSYARIDLDPNDVKTIQAYFSLYGFVAL